MTETGLADISHTIQLAVAPVFLLTAIGTVLSVLSTRLSRVIDRARHLEATFAQASADEQRKKKDELRTLSLRARFIHRALTSGVGASLCVCLLIVLAFLGYMAQASLSYVLAVLFIVALLLLVYALVNFLREIFISVQSLQFGIALVPPSAP